MLLLKEGEPNLRHFFEVALPRLFGLETARPRFRDVHVVPNYCQINK